MSIQSLVPVGSVLVDNYFTAPTLYTAGPRFETYNEAWDYAVARDEGCSRVTVDNRWTVEYPDGGSLDFIVDRITRKGEGNGG